MKEQPIKGKKARATARKSHRAAARRDLPETSVSVTFRHVEPTDALRAYAERKFVHVAKYLKRACSVHLILGVDKYRQNGEVTLKSGRLAVTAQEETKDLYAVIDLLTAKIERQLKSHLGKTSTRRVRTPSTGEVMSAVEES